MQLTGFKRHLSTAVAVFALAAGVGILQPASAQADAQAPAYWTFLNDNFRENQCLTGGQVNAQGTGKAYMSWCSGSFQQQWDWRGTDATAPQFLLLQNRATGLCLATDAKSDINVVWTSTCEWRPGMRFRYDFVGGSGGTLAVNHMSGGEYLRLRPASSGAVYNVVAAGSGDYSWVASHT